MKKRILSALLIATMIIVSSVSAFAFPAIGDSADVVYEGNVIFEEAEEILDELNVDAVSTPWAKDTAYHAAQLAVIKAVNESLDTADLSEAVDHLIAEDRMTDYRMKYLWALVKAETDPAIYDIVYNPAYSVAGLTMRDSFGFIDNYSSYISANIADVSVADYEAIKDDAKVYVEEALKVLLKVIFAQDGTGSYDDSGKFLRENYYDEFLSNDRVKKTLAVLFGANLTEEIVSENEANGKGFVRNSKAYINALSSDELLDKVTAGGNAVLVEDGSVAIETAFDQLGENIVEVYAGKDVLPDVIMLFGDGTEEGLVEKLVKAADPGFEASNIWLNLGLSKGVQLHTVASAIEDIKQNTASSLDFSNTTLGHESSIIIKTLDPASVGISTGAITLRNSWFDIEFYKEDGSAKLGGATFSDGQVSVIKDVARGVENAYMVLYRKNSSGDEKTFIETYPVKVDFTDGVSLPGPSGPSTSVDKYVVTFNTNGGSEIAPKKYEEGTVVQLTMVPTKDGYIFTGWYSDAELTNKIETLVAEKDVTIYAGWKKDGSTVVSKVEIPALLEGEDHYAYVMGYPDGNILPEGNITRAEAVTMIFRLLKDDVRTANLTEENVFEDVTADDWFNTAVSTLAKLGVVEGRTETTFVPNASITRAEFATMFARLAEYEFAAKNNYTDITNHWAKAFIEEVDAYGWIAGYEDDTFRPDTKITRAEAMTLINRVLKRTPQTKEDLLDGMTVWADNANESAWYYLAVQEATNSHEFERKENGFEKWTKLAENKDWTTFEK